MLDQYITGGIFMIVATVMLVSAVDKILSPNFPKIKENRGWLLPIASLVFGIFLFLMYTLSEGEPVNIFNVIFNGVNIGAFASFSYKMVREAILKRMGLSISRLNLSEHEDKDENY